MNPPQADFGSHMLQKISELEKKSAVRLGLAEKILLAETGTVEQILSILTESETMVTVKRQLESGGIIIRESWITNKKTGSKLIAARSKIFPQNLPRKAVDEVRRMEKGIGSIIFDLRMETFREILKIGYNSKAKYFFRIYRILYRGKVAFEIREEISKIR
jgi:chorismate-pyruvate lyase